MDFKIDNKYQPFNGFIYKIKYNDMDYFIGIGNLHEKVGMTIYYPQSGKNYFMVMLNNINYRFHLNEFKQKIGLDYIAEKLCCSLKEADMVYEVVRHILYKDAAFSLLANKLDDRNPILNDNIPT